MSDISNQTPEEQDGSITVSDTEPQEQLAPENPGVADGEVLTTTVPAEEAGGQITEVQEKVVFDYDSDGNQIGWHKEPVE